MILVSVRSGFLVRVLVGIVDVVVVTLPNVVDVDVALVVVVVML